MTNFLRSTTDHRRFVLTGADLCPEPFLQDFVDPLLVYIRLKRLEVVRDAAVGDLDVEAQW